MAHQVITLDPAAEATKEEEAAEAITDQAFQPTGPLASMPAAWAAGTTYAAGALVSEAGIVYRSQVAGNKGNKPDADADFANWTPVPFSLAAPLQNPDYNHAASAGANLGE